MAFWQITCGGVTQDAATWGIYGMKRKRKSADYDTVTFSMPKVPLDANPLPFTYRQTITILRNGQQWFTGVVTKPKGRGAPKSEVWNYEISGPWWYLEKTPFQQQWVTTNVAGDALTTITTTRTNVILGQSLDNISMNSGQVLMEVLRYAQYAAQFIPFPTTVDVTHLPPAPPTPGPFQIGLITPGITIPYTQVRDRSCADIIRYVLKFSPDCVASFDYSTSPPTLNIAARAQMAASPGPGGTAKTIQVFGTMIETNGYKTSGFNPEPRNDFVPLVVVLKFECKTSINGGTYDNLIVKSYPPAPAGIDPGAWESQPCAWVQTIDLIGGQTTQQSVDVNAVTRPVSEADNVAMNWILSKEPWLKSMRAGDGYSGDTQMWDWEHISCAHLAGTIDPNDPLNKDNPNFVPLPDCHTLVNELVSGDFPKWLQTDQSLDAARVLIEAWMTYNGTDAGTKQFFSFDPANPTVAKTDGSGYWVRYYNVRVTNASTQTYSELTSWSASEPVPQGMAQALYDSLAAMSLQGTFEITEIECSDLLPLGCIFNTVDGNPEWQTMNAQVLEVEEDIDHGVTTIRFGPPPILDAEEMEELFRAQLGRLPSWKLDQRTTGVLTAGSNVIGAKHAPESSPSHPPLQFGGGSDTNPYYPTDASAGATPQVAISDGTTGLTGATTTTGSPVTVPQGNGIIYIKTDFTYDAYNTVTITDSSFVATLETNPPASTCTPSSGGSGGSGTLYQKCASFNATVTNGKASTSPKRLIGGAQNFGVCNGAITGPWGV